MSKEEAEARVELVLTLPERIEAIYDGNRGPATQIYTSSSNKNIKFDSDGKLDDDFFQQSEESSQFRQEHEMRKIKQACSLSTLFFLLLTLRNILHLFIIFGCRMKVCR